MNFVFTRKNAADMKEEKLMANLNIVDNLARLTAILKARGILTQTDCDFITGDISMAEWIEANDNELHIGGTE